MPREQINPVPVPTANAAPVLIQTSAEERKAIPP